MNIVNKKIAIVGAGPAGICLMAALKRAKDRGENIPQIKCFEKQKDHGGQWNYDWRTSYGDNDEPMHSGMYKNLMSNAPKECLYFPDYPFEEHFNFDFPSFPPRSVIKDYISGYVKKHGIEKWINLNTIVKDVRYLKKKNKFKVLTYDCINRKTIEEEFDYVIVANGHFSVPNIPEVEGIEKFQGRMMHSHEFRDASEFENKVVLIVGGSHSAEDIGSHCYKYNCKKVIRSCRSEPIVLKWPSNWKDVPLMVKLDNNTAYFKDGTSEKIDTIVFCTGYKHHFPFLEDKLRLSTINRLWIEDLYKGVFWQENPNLVYLAMQDQIYTLPLFYAQAEYVTDVILNKITLPNKDDMKKDSKIWAQKELKLNPALDSPEPIIYQSEYVDSLLSETSNSEAFDIKAANEIFFDFLRHRSEDIMAFRDCSHASMITNKIAPKVKELCWVKDFSSDALEDYTSKYK